MTSERKTAETVVAEAMAAADEYTLVEDAICAALRAHGLLVREPDVVEGNAELLQNSGPDEDAVERAARAAYEAMWPSADRTLETETAKQRLRAGVRAALAAAGVSPRPVGGGSIECRGHCERRGVQQVETGLDEVRRLSVEDLGFEYGLLVVRTVPGDESWLGKVFGIGDESHARRARGAANGNQVVMMRRRRAGPWDQVPGI